MSDLMDLDGYLLCMDKSHGRFAGYRRAQFRHVALIEQDGINPKRWLLRQWRNHREMVRVVLADDFKDDKGEIIQMKLAIQRHMLDADMDGGPDPDVQMIEVKIPQVRKPRALCWFKANDVGYVKQRLGVRDWKIRTPHQLYSFYKTHGADAVEKSKEKKAKAGQGGGLWVGLFRVVAWVDRNA